MDRSLHGLCQCVAKRCIARPAPNHNPLRHGFRKEHRNGGYRPRRQSGQGCRTIGRRQPRQVIAQTARWGNRPLAIPHHPGGKAQFIVKTVTVQ